MSDHDALLAAVCAAPADDLPRLVMADWLYETGDPADRDRSEFIRLQIGLREPARRLKDADERAARAAARKADRGRVKALLAQHGKWWGQPLAPAYGIEYVRGFVEHAAFAAADCLKDLPAVFAAAPVRDIYVHTINSPDLSYPLVEYLDAQKVWERLTSVSLSLQGLTDDQVLSLADFDLFWRVTDAEVIRLAAN